MRYIVYCGDGSGERCTCDSIEYSDKMMGESAVLVNVGSAYPIGFSVGDYIVYRGIRYVLDNLHNVEKVARAGSYGGAFNYQNVKFVGPDGMLSHVRFLDFVRDDGSPSGNNSLHYSNSPKWSLFCERIEDFIERVQVNLDRVYDDWKVEVCSTPFEYAHNVTISVDNISVLDALGMIDSQFKTCYRVTQREEGGKLWNVIVVGEELDLGSRMNVYKSGLTKIERVVGDSPIVNRLRVYGSTKNMPLKYYSKGNYRVIRIDPWTDASWGEGEDILVDSEELQVSDLDVDLQKELGVYGDSDISSVTRYIVKYLTPAGFPWDSYAEEGRKIKIQHEGVNVGRKIGTFGWTILGSDVNASKRGFLMVIYWRIGDNDEWVKCATRPLLMFGLPSKDVSQMQDYWSSTFLLSPSAMNVDHLMLLSFLDYYAIDKFGNEVVLNKRTTTYLTDDSGNITAYVDADGATYTPVYVLDDAGNHLLDAKDHWMVKQELDPYIEDSDSVAQYGVREGCVYFDTENEEEHITEIYPSLKGIRAEDAIAAGYDISLRLRDNGLLDEIVRGTIGEPSISGIKEADEAYKNEYWYITDDGMTTDKDGKVSPAHFYLDLKDLGFEINYTEDAVIHIEDGMCGGREFKFANMSAYPNRRAVIENGHRFYVYRFRLERVYDEALGMYFPNKDYPIRSGDKFVLLGIEMPDMYIDAAASKLEAAGREYLNDHKTPDVLVNPTFDSIALRREYDFMGEKSVYWLIQAGTIIRFKDDDIGVRVGTGDGEVKLYIESLTIREDGTNLPEVSVSLKKGRTFSALERIEHDIHYIRANSGDGVTVQQVRAIAEGKVEGKYLSKTDDDVAAGKITFEQPIISKGGIQSEDFDAGVRGGGLWVDESGDWHFDVDYLSARKKMYAKELDIEEVKSVGGQMLLTAAHCKLEKVEERAGDRTIRCYFLAQDSDGRTIANKWMKFDQAYTRTFDMTSGDHYFWRIVMGVGTEGEYHYIDLSDAVGMGEGDMPLVGDQVVQLGHRGGDSDRTGAILMAGAGSHSPYIRIFTGITTFALPPHPEIQLKPGDNSFSGHVQITGGSGAGNLTDLPSEVRSVVKIGGENLLLNSGFDGNYTSEEISEHELVGGTETYSARMGEWTYTEGVESVECERAVSGYACRIPRSGWLSQVVTLDAGTEYMLSMQSSDALYLFVNDNGSGIGVPDTWGNTEWPITGDGEVTLKFICSPKKEYVDICDLKLERGTIATDWCPSQQDNGRAAAGFKDLWYLQRALREGSTDILGGLILSNILKLGNYRNGAMVEETAGLSGVMSDGGDVSFWSGGRYVDAVRTINRIRSGEAISDEEWNGFVGSVITHGGDSFLKGYIYALGGVFRGKIYADGGVFRGNVYADGGVFRGFSRCVMTDVTPENFSECFRVNSGSYKIDIEKTGCLFRLRGDFQSLTGATFSCKLPMIDWDSNSEAVRNEVRALDIRRIVCYNQSNSNIRFWFSKMKGGLVGNEYHLLEPGCWACFTCSVGVWTMSGGITRDYLEYSVVCGYVGIEGW